MVRVVRTRDGAVVDRKQRLPGRGAYVHDDPACVDRAVRRGGIARALGCEVPAALLTALGDDGKQGG